MRQVVVVLAAGSLLVAALTGCSPTTSTSDSCPRGGTSTLTSLTAGSGDVAWRAEVRQVPWADTRERALLLGGGHVVVKGACGAAVVDAVTGAVRYDRSPDGEVLGATRDRLFVRADSDSDSDSDSDAGSDGGVRLDGVDLASGRTVTSYSTNLRYQVAAVAGGHLVSLYGDQLSGNDESARGWVTQLTLGGQPQLVADGGLLLAVGGDGSTYAVRMTDGDLVWRTVAPVPATSYALQLTTVPGTVLTAATTYDDSSSERSFVYATDARTGTLGWSRPALAVLAADRDLTLLQTPHAIVAVDTGNGDVQWRRPTRDAAASHDPGSAALTGGVVAVVQAGRLVGLDALSGHVRWRGAEARSVVAAGAVVVATTEQGVVAVDADTGATRWTRPPTRERQEVVVEGRRVLVLDTALLGHVIEG